MLQRCSKRPPKDALKITAYHSDSPLWQDSLNLMPTGPEMIVIPCPRSQSPLNSGVPGFVFRIRITHAQNGDTMSPSPIYLAHPWSRTPKWNSFKQSSQQDSRPGYLHDIKLHIEKMNFFALGNSKYMMWTMTKHGSNMICPRGPLRPSRNWCFRIACDLMKNFQTRMLGLDSSAACGETPHVTAKQSRSLQIYRTAK